MASEQEQGTQTETSDLATAVGVGMSVFANLWLWAFSLLFAFLSYAYFPGSRAAGWLMLGAAALTNPLLYKLAVSIAVESGQRPPSLGLMVMIGFCCFAAGLYFVVA